MERPLSGRDVFLEWQELLKRFEASELSLDEFCRQEDLGRSTFRDWLQALKKEPLREGAVEGETRSAGRSALTSSCSSNRTLARRPAMSRIRLTTASAWAVTCARRGRSSHSPFGRQKRGRQAHEGLHLPRLSGVLNHAMSCRGSATVVVGTLGTTTEIGQ